MSDRRLDVASGVAALSAKAAKAAKAAKVPEAPESHEDNLSRRSPSYRDAGTA